MTTTQLEIMPADAGENAKRADAPAIWQSFADKAAELAETAKSLTVTDASQTKLMQEARNIRLKLKDLRCDVERKRKEMTEHHLREKQRIDKDAKTLKDIIEPLEDRMLEQETFKERQESAEKAKLKAERIEALTPFCFDPTVFNVESMTEEAFAQFLSDAKAGHEKRLADAAKEKADREAAEKAAAEERARIQAENEKLKAEAEAARQEKLKELLAREKAEAELAAKKAAEAKAEADRIEAERKAAAAPDAEKLCAFADALLAIPMPDFSDRVPAATVALITIQREKFHAWLRSTAAKF